MMTHRGIQHANLGGSMAAPSISLSADEQDRYEQEGANARLRGGSRDHCPYDEATHSAEWRSWVCGFGYAAAELMVLNGGRYFVSTTESPPSDFDLSGPFIPIRVAIENGYWQPRFVTLAMLDEIEKAKAA